MQRLQNIFKQVLATLSFFTRLPFWRLCDIPAEHYKRVVPLWPLAGWVTGGVMVGVLVTAIEVLPLNVCVILALVARVLLTGALHEDGFADFCDGFGGGTSRERILSIMKDSHIGTYGVLGLVLYYMTMYNIFSEVVIYYGVGAVLIADCWAKFTSSMIVWCLPYARNAETAKNRLVYSSVSMWEKAAGLLFAALPFILFCPEHYEVHFLIAFLISVIVAGSMFLMMKRKIGGYTGDCCGATFIITELTIHMMLLALW